jgi:hypothetical protein
MEKENQFAAPSKQSEPKLFSGAVDLPHSRVDPCFMTGKGCVYTEIIDRAINERKLNGESIGFSVMPFRGNFNVFYKNCLELYFRSNFKNKVHLQRADEVRRPGIIICEGVCKRIQESDFVTVDVSLPNPNVFYELGLAYGIHQKIVVIYHHSALFGKEITDVLKHLGCNPFPYQDLNPIPIEEFNRDRYIWRLPSEGSNLPSTSPKILFYEHQSDGEKQVEFSDDITLSFQTHVRSAIGIGIAKIVDDHTEKRSDQPIIKSYLKTIKGFMQAITVKIDANPRETKDLVDSAYCILIRTGTRSCHPMAYFWLGYGHARGINVIPITVLNEHNDTVEDLAFDIRAQRHMFFYRSSPDSFENELSSSLNQMIINDFSDWSRKRFWNHILGSRGEVSIFTGALHNKDFDREMIGDWDLRSASELTSYFARQQYRATIENPMYTPEYPKRNPNTPISVYINVLKSMLIDKNCILIASPDVNPLTEIVLGKIYNIPDELLFSEPTKNQNQKNPDAMIVVKEKIPGTDNKSGTVAKRYFYREIHPQDSSVRKRGFESQQLFNGHIMTEFISQEDSRKEPFYVLGQILIVPNPFRKTSLGSKRFIIILNGVSGPATFALTHVLTGGVTSEFVDYSSDFDPETKSEEIVLGLLDMLGRSGIQGLDCIVSVRIGKAHEDQQPGSEDISDWRKILGWELNTNARPNAIKPLQ